MKGSQPEYTREKAAQWEERTNSGGYRSARKNILASLPLGAQVYVDAACGTGALIREIATRKPYQLIVGTDASPEMLEKAKRNLEAGGIRVEQVAARDIQPDRRGVVLTLDDLTDSQLPSQFADVVTFCFPELGVDYPEEIAIDELIVARCLQQEFRLGEKSYLLSMISLRTDYHLARITRHGRTIVKALYDTSEGKNSAYDRALANCFRRQGQVTGMEFRGHRFFGNPEVWSDTEPDPQQHPDSHVLERKGFRILVYTKREHVERNGQQVRMGL